MLPPPGPHCRILQVVISPMPTSGASEVDPLKPKVHPQSSRELMEGSQDCRHVVSSDKNQSEACSCIQTFPSVRFTLVLHTLVFLPAGRGLFSLILSESHELTLSHRQLSAVGRLQRGQKIYNRL